MAGLAIGVYATTFLTVNNTATIQTGASLQATGAVPSATACSGASGYGLSPSVPWGSVIAGTTSKQYICVENVGTSPYLVSITTSLPLTAGTITSPESSQTVVPGGFLLVEFDWAVNPTASLGGVGFVITFQ